ncbi:unnamed protein product [Amaranthus hypochondriacus]
MSQVTKSLVFLAMTTLVMAFVASGARILADAGNVNAGDVGGLLGGAQNTVDGVLGGVLPGGQDPVNSVVGADGLAKGVLNDPLGNVVGGVGGLPALGGVVKDDPTLPSVSDVKGPHN